MQNPLALSRLDDLLAALDHEHSERCSLLREHLQGARAYLVGMMPEEYVLNLRLAAGALDCVGNKDLRQQLDEFIRRELNDSRQLTATGYQWHSGS